MPDLVATHDFDRAAMVALSRLTRDLNRQPALDEVELAIHNRTLDDLICNPAAREYLTMTADGTKWRGVRLLGVDNLARDRVKARFVLEWTEEIHHV